MGDTPAPPGMLPKFDLSRGLSLPLSIAHIVVSQAFEKSERLPKAVILSEVGEAKDLASVLVR